MKNYFKNVKITSLILCLFYMFFGVSLIVWPNATKFTIISLVGALVAAHGIMSIVNYFVYGYEPFGFMTGCLNLTVGILCMITASTLANSGIFSLIFAILFIFSGLGKVQTSFDYRRLGSKYWWINSIFGTIVFVLGIVLLCNPFGSEKYLLIFLGVGVIIDSIAQIISIFVTAHRIKKIKHKVRDLFKKTDDNVIDMTDE